MFHFLRARIAHSTTLALLLSLALVLDRPEASARVNLEVLQHDGYGMVELKRPDPNVLTVVASINGHKVRLVVDTGWGPGGIFLHNDQLSAVSLKTEDIKQDLTTAFGGKMAGIKGARADKVAIGNVELAQVPIFFGNLKTLREGRTMHKLGADGFIGAGFMKTCSGVLDLQNLRLYLRPPGKGRRALIGPALTGAGLAEVSMSAATAVPVEINGSPGKMVVDTGAYHAGADVRFAEKIHAASRGSRVGGFDATNKIIATKLMQLRSFKIGGVNATAPDLRLTTFGFYSPDGLIGLLGMDILGPNGAIIDFGAGKLYFYPAASR
ncbi:MAG TPA: aspartyl protease family protein [Chthoniobacterales bacterium]|nr:aspartyl protease family protein [Chthoniobacterales bacterium]